MSNKSYQQKIREFRKMHSELIHTIYINSLEKAREYYDKKLSTIDSHKLQFVSNSTAYLYDENNNKIFAEILEDGELCYYEWFDQFGRVIYRKRFEEDESFSDCFFIYDPRFNTVDHCIYALASDNTFDKRIFDDRGRRIYYERTDEYAKSGTTTIITEYIGDNSSERETVEIDDNWIEHCRFDNDGHIVYHQRPGFKWSYEYDEYNKLTKSIDLLNNHEFIIINRDRGPDYLFGRYIKSYDCSIIGEFDFKERFFDDALSDVMRHERKISTITHHNDYTHIRYTDGYEEYLYYDENNHITHSIDNDGFEIWYTVDDDNNLVVDHYTEGFDVIRINTKSRYSIRRVWQPCKISDEKMKRLSSIISKMVRTKM